MAAAAEAPISALEAEAGEDRLRVVVDVDIDGEGAIDVELADLLADFELKKIELGEEVVELGDADSGLDDVLQIETLEAFSPEEGVEELFGLSIEEEEEEDETYLQMVETIQSIESCYEGSELPPMVTLLNEMVEARNYEGIRNDITNIWNQLLKFHQKRGLRIQPQVTTTFNTINKIVRNL
jgi:hypothetical protein